LNEVYHLGGYPELQAPTDPSSIRILVRGTHRVLTTPALEEREAPAEVGQGEGTHPGQVRHIDLTKEGESNWAQGKNPLMNPWKWKTCLRKQKVFPK
jgi:hypothetical protein